MPLLNLPGAELFYETQGSGPLLLFIAGANGDGVIFHPLAQHLKDNFTIITYDRRGFSQSLLTGDQDYSQRLQRDADDAAELIKHVASSKPDPDTSSPVFVLGSSSGAIVALNLLCQHPDLVTKVIVHEAPCMHAFPEDGARQGIESIQQLYELYRARGVHAAMQQFIQHFLVPEDAAAMSGYDPRTRPYAWGNLLYWFEREFAYPSSEIPWAVLEKDNLKEKLVFGISEDAGQFIPALCCRALAGRLSLDSNIFTFAGAHLGYATKPEEFAGSMRKCLSV